MLVEQMERASFFRGQSVSFVRRPDPAAERCREFLALSVISEQNFEGVGRKGRDAIDTARDVAHLYSSLAVELDIVLRCDPP